MRPIAKRSVIKKESKTQRISLACLNCRKKKIKCNGENPCINCVNYKCECAYPNGKTTSNSLSPQNTNRQLPSNILKLIENLQTIDENESCEFINEQIDALNRALVSSKDTTPEKDDGQTSKETKHKDQAYLTRFHNSSPNETIADQYFGLFCVTSLLTSGGRNWFLTRCCQYNSKFKDTIILGSQMTFGSIHKIVVEEMTLWEDICSLHDLSKLIDLEIKPEFVEYLVEKHFDAVANHHYNFKSFITKEFIKTTQLQLFEKKNPINKSKLLIFLCFLLDTCYLEMRFANEKELAKLIRIEKVLLKSCIVYVKVSAFTFSEFDNISGLLYFLKLIDNRNATAYYNSLLAHAVNLIEKFGLHRMEYYVGLNEIEADIKRTLFWELYCMDKECFIFEGRLIMMLDDEEITTFLPNNVAEIDESLIKGTFKLDENNIMSYIRLCEINLCHFICKIYKKLIGKNTASKVREELIEELEELRDSIIVDIRPGFNINIGKFKLQNSQLLRVKELHIKYHSALLFILVNTMKRSNNNGPTGSLYSFDLEINCSLTILEIILGINVLDESTINSLSKYGLFSFFPLIECFLSVPMHQKSKIIIKTLMNFHLRVNEIVRLNSSTWKITNKIMSYMMEPILEIYKTQSNNDTTTINSFMENFEFYQNQKKLNESKVDKIHDIQHQLDQERLAETENQESDNSLMNGLFTLNQDLGSNIDGSLFYEKDWKDLFSGLY